MGLIGNPQDWSSTTKQGAVRDAFGKALMHNHIDADCPVCLTVWTALKQDSRIDGPVLGEAPLVFRSRGADGKLVDMPRGRARSTRLRHFVHEVAAHANGTFALPTVDEPKAEPKAEPKPTNVRLSPDQSRFLSEVRRIRPEAKAREIDHISYRPVEDGMRMIAAGISVEGCLHAMTMHWDEADRRQMGIAPFDPYTDHPGGMDAYLDCLVKARVTIYLFGEAGYGKSYWAKNLAAKRNVDYGFTPMTEGASVSWLLGRVDAQGFKPTKLLEIWSHGGVYLFDEADAADPNMLLVMNGPLAGGLLENPVNQKSYPKSQDCTIVFAGNTDGFGADAKYGARNPFDFSTFDRIRMGRANVGYNRDVEEQIALQNAAL